MNVNNKMMDEQLLLGSFDNFSHYGLNPGPFRLKSEVKRLFYVPEGGEGRKIA